jgi:hypothetical protein
MADVFDIKTKQLQSKEQLDDFTSEVHTFFIIGLDLLKRTKNEHFVELLKAQEQLKSTCNILLNTRTDLDELEVDFYAGEFEITEVQTEQTEETTDE